MNKNDILQNMFGYASFRNGQEPIIDAILNGNDTMTIMPTGGGKSLCYQIPAILLGGTNLVVSPLISLMKDQVNMLNANGIPAAYINSTLSSAQTRVIYERAAKGDYNLLYIAPEQLLTQRFIELSQHLSIHMIAVDEAHCVSHWGQDFRPSYMNIVKFVDTLAIRPRICAFTATATQKVKNDIVSRLQLIDPLETQTGFDRPNLYFKTLQVGNSDKADVIVSYIKKHPEDFGIVYCQTRKEVESLSAYLEANNISNAAYHAGFDTTTRSKHQDLFLRDDVHVMIATNAFGMGIDKSNVSYVIHHNMPKNIENYYQEAGRAGRDGSNAYCLMLYSNADTRTNRFFINNATPNAEQSPEAFELFIQNEQKRLNAINAYARTHQCLRKTLLEYFGEKAPDTCQYCHNCLHEFDTIDITQETLKILSCIFRLEERFGMTLIIEVLRGSQNRRILDLHLDKIPTHGILKDKSAHEIKAIINSLIDQEILRQSDDEYTVLKLTPKAGSVLKGNYHVSMIKPKHIQKDLSKSTRSRKGHTSVENLALFNALRKLRKKIADEKNVPAFVVFSDLTLKDMTRKLPTNADMFLSVDGVGKVKLESYGALFIACIQNYLKETTAKKS